MARNLCHARAAMAPALVILPLLLGAGCASDPPADSPPSSASASGAPAGALLIVGGGRQPASLVERFVELAGGAGSARIAVIPLASSVPVESGAGKVSQFEEFGANAFMVNPTREEALAAAGAARLDDVTGIWFTGGDQARITAALVDTPLLDAVHAARARGAVIGGTSAGAAIMSDSMLTGNQVRDDSLAYYGDDFHTIAYRTIEVVPGLGFLPGTVVDQHFLVRERHNRLLSVILERPSLIGVGIDESTALEVRDGIWTVLGESQVLIVDARRARLAAATGPAGAAHVALHLLPPGATYDPASGAVELPQALEVSGSLPSSENAS